VLARPVGSPTQYARHLFRFLSVGFANRPPPQTSKRRAHDRNRFRKTFDNGRHPVHDLSIPVALFLACFFAGSTAYGFRRFRSGRKGY
jgi:hypothetical protein